jgi:hypothetical protein
MRNISFVILLELVAGARVRHGRGLAQKKKTGCCYERERKNMGGGLTGAAQRGVAAQGLDWRLGRSR